MKMEQTEGSETLADKIQKAGNHLKERIGHSEHDESLKSITLLFFSTALNLMIVLS